jgi:hypothetical protein
METDKSEPSPESALAACVAIAKSFSTSKQTAIPYLNVFNTPRNATPRTLVSYDAINRAASKSTLIFSDRILRLQSGSSILSCYSHFIATTTEAASGARTGKKRQRRPVVQSGFGVECGGCVFGVSLADLLLFSSVGSMSVAAMTRMLHSALVPVGIAVLATRGADAEGLCRGVAAHRTCKAQVLRQIPSALKMHPKHGSPNTVIGMCCAIYAIFSMLGNDIPHETKQSHINDVAWLVSRQSLLSALIQAEDRTKFAIPQGLKFGAPGLEVEAFEIETRAIQRAKAGVRTAMAICERQAFGHIDSFRLQLSYFRIAAWPREERLGADNHEEMLEKLTNALFFASQNQTPSQFTFGSGFVVPLSELAGVARDDRGAYDTASSYGSASSHAALSAGSSNGDDNEGDAVVFDATRAFESCGVRH